jgi:hypothetical protein
MTRRVPQIQKDYYDIVLPTEQKAATGIKGRLASVPAQGDSASKQESSASAASTTPASAPAPDDSTGTPEPPVTPASTTPASAAAEGDSAETQESPGSAPSTAPASPPMVETAVLQISEHDAVGAIQTSREVMQVIEKKGSVEIPERTSSDIRKDLIDTYMYLISSPFLAIAMYYLLQIISDKTPKPVLVLMAFATGLISASVVKWITDFADRTLGNAAS